MMKPVSHSRQLGKLMCAVTEQVLWAPPLNPLVCRVGSGQATYHRFDCHSRQHRITYGARMIAAKHRPETASGWLSVREIQQRGYFDGQLSPLNLLAHTCCHEFAHLLQHNAGQRYRGSVHNRHFYRILDDLHSAGRAEEVRCALRDKVRSQGLELSATAFVPADPAAELVQWQPGDMVSFGTRQTEIHGRIVRVNRKSCTVDGTGLAKGMRYRVPSRMLQRVESPA